MELQYDDIVIFNANYSVLHRTEIIAGYYSLYQFVPNGLQNVRGLYTGYCYTAIIYIVYTTVC